VPPGAPGPGPLGRAGPPPAPPPPPPPRSAGRGGCGPSAWAQARSGLAHSVSVLRPPAATRARATTCLPGGRWRAAHRTGSLGPQQAAGRPRVPQAAHAALAQQATGGLRARQVRQWRPIRLPVLRARRRRGRPAARAGRPARGAPGVRPPGRSRLVSWARLLPCCVRAGAAAAACCVGVRLTLLSEPARRVARLSKSMPRQLMRSSLAAAAKVGLVTTPPSCASRGEVAVGARDERHMGTSHASLSFAGVQHAPPRGTNGCTGQGQVPA